MRAADRITRRRLESNPVGCADDRKRNGVSHAECRTLRLARARHKHRRPANLTHQQVTPMSTARPFRRHLAYLDWLYNPFRSWDVTRVYDLLSTDVATENGLYLNLGYWTGEQTLDEACQALAALVAERAAMGPGDRVLDVGFGFADQDIYWLRTYAPDHIQGLNITASQVAVARGRVKDLGLEERIDLREGSATDMPLPSNSVDTVVALECAFHFKTRERFFEEAFRVLRPGGRLVTADIIPMPLVRWLAYPPQTTLVLETRREQVRDPRRKRLHARDLCGKARRLRVSRGRGRLHPRSRLHPPARLSVETSRNARPTPPRNPTPGQTRTRHECRERLRGSGLCARRSPKTALILKPRLFVTCEVLPGTTLTTTKRLIPGAV